MLTAREEQLANHLNKIFRIWRKYPNLRLLQLLLNAIKEENLYNITDEELQKKLKERYAECFKTR